VRASSSVQLRGRVVIGKKVSDVYYEDSRDHAVPPCDHAVPLCDRVFS
jgi:hypothetical protein